MHDDELVMEFCLAQGLKFGFTLFNANQFEIRIRNVERKLSELTTNLDVLSHENNRFRRQLNNFSKFQRKEIEGKVRAILSGDRRRTENETAIVSLVMSLGYLFKGIVLNGNVEPDCYGGPSEFTLLMSGYLSSSENIEAISKLEKFTSITGIRIDTKRIRSAKEMKDIGTAVISFYKVLQIFNREFMPLSDEFPVGNEAIVHILFDGMFNMGFVLSHPALENAEFDFFRVAHKNVYIFGQNGAGKSTWGNIISALDKGPRFKVGDAVHTTIMPTHHDVGPNDAFRLWDLPGVGDPSDYATAMERHITDTINNNRRYSAVIFIFNGRIQPNETVKRILKFAEDLFGPSVHKSFIAIVNKFDENTKKKSESYAKLLHDHKFIVKRKSFYTLSDSEEFDEYQTIREVISTFPARFVGKYQLRIDELFKKHKGDVNQILIDLHQDCKEELDEFIENARVSTILNDKHRWFFGQDGEEPESITIRTHTVGVFGNRENDKYEDKVIKLDDTTRAGRLSVQTLQRTWFYEQKNIILNGILEHPDHILIYSSDQKYDYVLFNISTLTEERKTSILDMQLGMRFDEDDLGSESSSVRSQWSFGQ